MRVTPLDIQKHRFRMQLRGYDPSEVRAFLLSFAEQYEVVVRENAQQREQLGVLRERLREHEEKERVLKDTLFAAQAAAEQMRGTARREAEIVVKEAELAAEKMMEAARERAALSEKRIIDLKGLRRELLAQVKDMVRRQADVLADWEETGEGNVVRLAEAPRRSGTLPAE